MGAVPRETRVLEQARKTKLVGANVAVGGTFGAWLVPREGKQAGQIFPLHAENVVGAKPEACHVVLDEEHVSSRHAKLVWNAGQSTWSLVDLGSTNGTYVGDSKLAKDERYVGLLDGDILQFGTLKVTFKCG